MGRDKKTTKPPARLGNADAGGGDVFDRISSDLRGDGGKVCDDGDEGSSLRRLIDELDAMEKIVCRIVDDGETCKDFEMMAAINAIEYEICQARKLAEKQKGNDGNRSGKF